jgi:aspartate racemase
MAKLIGIIGGVSWESTVLYYQLINQFIRDHFGGLNSARLLISSLNYDPIVKFEQENNWKAVADILVDSALGLEKAGSELIILGCNTLHKVSPAIEKSIKIPFIHIADSVGNALSQTGIKKVGLLGTQFTMEDGFYTERLQDKFNLHVVTPELNERLMIDNIIYKELCLGKVLKTSRTFFAKTMEALANAGAEGVILGCTEFNMLVQSGDSPIPTFDSTILHAKNAVDLSLT